jgi:hypothetical protein
LLKVAQFYCIYLQQKKKILKTEKVAVQTEREYKLETAVFQLACTEKNPARKRCWWQGK